MGIADVGSLLKMVEDADLPKALADVTLTAFVGAVGWFVGRRFERRSARRETALKACNTTSH
jgi:hypothetical protein